MIAHSFGIDGNELSGAKFASKVVVNDTECALCNTQQCAQPPLALSVPLSRFTRESAVAQLSTLGQKATLSAWA